MSNMKTHMEHCYQGEYETSCKYGDKDCPAKPDIRCGRCKELLDENMMYNIETPNIIIYLCLECAVEVEDDLMHLAYKTTTHDANHVEGEK